LEVSVATMLEGLTGHVLDKVQKVKLCQRAEHDFAHVPCGLMDQFVSVFGLRGHAVLIDCDKEEVTPFPMADSSVVVLVTNSNVRHSLGEGQYAKYGVGVLA
jgi:galactokinase